jgi:hypothetical protein
MKHHNALAQKIKDQQQKNCLKAKSRPQTSKPVPKSNPLADFKLSEDILQVNSNFSHRPLRPKDERRPQLVGTGQFH